MACTELAQRSKSAGVAQRVSGHVGAGGDHEVFLVLDRELQRRGDLVRGQVRGELGFLRFGARHRPRAEDRGERPAEHQHRRQREPEVAVAAPQRVQAPDPLARGEPGGHPGADRRADDLRGGHCDLWDDRGAGGRFPRGSVPASAHGAPPGAGRTDVLVSIAIDAAGAASRRDCGSAAPDGWG